ncbi:lipoyl(octanoyl) transferase LipB [Arthrobacter sp. JZ12]|uniref:lipoyl(octanoyl) transferase LipB n=1 Tax=Arthrobacter sp. JZ12 TaxID=2654190 RepID=UPI002B477EF3|nr:lipoyl(octanoyl) transferase LipB [Arthrobacter sp. JZ12]WRH24753.1 lipoyl(octanoyl) transferase LipB [Arthrobacter sp. JZ12]
MTLEFSRIGFDPHFVDYLDGWERQRVLHEAVVEGTHPSTVLLLEHSPVYTAGKRTEEHEKPFDGTPVVPVDRGGKLTWHGPGQLVGYPILALPEPTRVADYVGILEDVIIAVLQDYNIRGVRIEGRSGVWLAADDQKPARKIAAIGIRINRRVTMHGFAINCSNDLSPFAQIIPCGITDAGVTSISAELGRTVTPADIVSRIEEELRKNKESLVLDAETVVPASGTAQAVGNDQPEGALL